MIKWKSKMFHGMIEFKMNVWIMVIKLRVMMNEINYRIGLMKLIFRIQKIFDKMNKEIELAIAGILRITSYFWRLYVCMERIITKFACI